MPIGLKTTDDEQGDLSAIRPDARLQSDRRQDPARRGPEGRRNLARDPPAVPGCGPTPRGTQNHRDRSSGYPILDVDDAEGWGRLNLFAAADGYGAFDGDVTGGNGRQLWRLSSNGQLAQRYLRSRQVDQARHRHTQAAGSQSLPRRHGNPGRRVGGRFRDGPGARRCLRQRRHLGQQQLPPRSTSMATTPSSPVPHWN